MLNAEVERDSGSLCVGYACANAAFNCKHKNALNCVNTTPQSSEHKCRAVLPNLIG